jgi:hypothetical protein
MTWQLLSSSDYPPLAVAAMGYVVGSISVGLVLPVCKLEPEAWAFLGDTTALGALMCERSLPPPSAQHRNHPGPNLATTLVPTRGS